MMKFFVLITIALFSFSSCIHLASTKYSYENVLSNPAKSNVHFSGDDSSFHISPLTIREKLFLINGKQLKTYLSNNNSTIVYLYLPYCSSPSQIPIETFKERVSHYKSNYIIVLRDITSDFYVNLFHDCNVVGIDYKHYHRTFNENLFLKDLIGSQNAYKHRYNTFLLFQREKIISSGNNIDTLFSGTQYSNNQEPQ